MTQDLISGRPLKLIVGFAIPVLFSALLQQFYSFVDAAPVEKILGANALAAVGATVTVMYMVIGFCSEVCAGFAIPMAQAFGARQENELKRHIGNCLWLCIGIWRSSHSHFRLLGCIHRQSGRLGRSKLFPDPRLHLLHSEVYKAHHT